MAHACLIEDSTLDRSCNTHIRETFCGRISDLPGELVNPQWNHWLGESTMDIQVRLSGRSVGFTQQYWEPRAYKQAMVDGAC